LAEEQVLDVLLDHVSRSNLGDGVGAIDSLNLFLVVLMAERGQVSDRAERDARFLSNNDDLLKVGSEVVCPEIVEIAAWIEQEDWNTADDIAEEVE